MPTNTPHWIAWTGTPPDIAAGDPLEPVPVPPITVTEHVLNQVEAAFLKKKATKLDKEMSVLKSNVSDIFNVVRRGGSARHSDFVDSDALLGIEIEVENWNGAVVPGWIHKEDGSLRNKGREFTVGPVRSGELQPVLAQFCEAAAKHKWQATVRTGIHVHINMSDRDGEFLLRFVECYLAVERTLFKYAGEWRRWCNFCHPLEEANEPLLILRSILNGEADNRALRNMGKYAGLNLCSLLQFGTVELRILPTTFNYNQIVGWINAILGIYEFANKLRAEGVGYIDYFKAYGVDKIIEETLYAHKISAAEFSDVVYRGDFLRAHRHIRWLGVKTADNWDAVLKLDLDKLTKPVANVADNFSALKKMLGPAGAELQAITAEINRLFYQEAPSSIYFIDERQQESAKTRLASLVSRTGAFGKAFANVIPQLGI